MQAYMIYASGLGAMYSADVRVEKATVGDCVGMQISKASSGAPASALATLGDGLVFLGSWLADSLLLQTTRTAGQVWVPSLSGYSCSCRPLSSGLQRPLLITAAPIQMMHWLHVSWAKLQSLHLVSKPGDTIRMTVQEMEVGQEVYTRQSGRVPVCFGTLAGDCHWRHHLCKGFMCNEHSLT